MMNTKSKRDDISTESIDTEKKMTILKSFMPINMTTQINWTNSLKDTIYEKSSRRNIKLLGHLLKKLNLLLKTSQRKLQVQMASLMKPIEHLRNEEY